MPANLICPVMPTKESINKHHDAIHDSLMESTRYFEELSSDLGNKETKGKPRLELVDTYAMEQLGHVLAYGADTKYREWNWAKGIKYSTLAGATLRHVFAFLRGHDTDEESGLPHLAHAMCNCMMLLAMTRRHPELDDRNKV